MATLVWGILAAMAVVMVIGWACQRAAQNGGWTDVFWTYGTGATCAMAALIPLGEQPGQPWRRMMVAAMMALWSLRLGTYVALRVSRSREDVRYAALRTEWGDKFQRNMVVLLVSQAPLTAIIGVSVLFAARHPASAFRPWDALGLLVFLVAILGETVSDRQMQVFKADKANQGKVCDKGLWSWSRHPNYFFEALIWIAYPVIGVDPSQPWSLATLIAPVMMFAIVRYGTGIPPLEKAMVNSKGDAYRRYQAEVSPLFLRPRQSRVR